MREPVAETRLCTALHIVIFISYALRVIFCNLQSNFEQGQGRTSILSHPTGIHGTSRQLRSVMTVLKELGVCSMIMT